MIDNQQILIDILCQYFNVYFIDDFLKAGITMIEKLSCSFSFQTNGCTSKNRIPPIVKRLLRFSFFFIHYFMSMRSSERKMQQTHLFIHSNQTTTVASFAQTV